MSTDDFFRSRLDLMINLGHSLAVLSEKMPWEILEETLELIFEHRDRKDREFFCEDIFGKNMQVAGAWVSNAGCLNTDKRV